MPEGSRPPTAGARTPRSSTVGGRGAVSGPAPACLPAPRRTGQPITENYSLVTTLSASARSKSSEGVDQANGNHHDATRTRTSDTANAVRQRDAMARRAGGSSVRDRFGQRANQWTGRRWARGAKGSTKHRDGDNRSAKADAPKNEPPAGAEAQAPPSPGWIQAGGSPSNRRADCWTSSVTSCDHLRNVRPRTIARQH